MRQWVKYEVERNRRERSPEGSNERLAQFADAATRDLQEPLWMVSSHLQLLETRDSDVLEEAVDHLAHPVGAVDGEREELLAVLLEYSHVETRGDPFEPVDLEDALTDSGDEPPRVHVSEQRRG